MLHLSVRQLIADRYLAVHGASPSIDYPSYCIVQGPAGPRAALGYRQAAAGPLFLEAYLKAPVEAVLAERLGRPVPRDRIVEIGDHASDRPHATLLLWASAARLLAGEAEIAVAVLTRPLRAMFGRIGLPIVELDAASPGSLGAANSFWGRYYDSDPIVCAGDIAAGRDCLDRWCATEAAA